jgi:peptidoglycan/xylan/chitin deacetylase (PgdA/CDA1 family)
MVCVTFDDGLQSNYTLGLPVIRELGIGCTVFVPTDFVGHDRRFPWEYCEDDPPMTWDQVREMQETGVDIQSHGCSHEDFSQLSDEALTRELDESRDVIKERLGVESVAVAYPFGYYEQRVEEAVRRSGYRAAYAITAPIEAEDAYAIPRISVRYQTTMLGFRLRVWGVHSFIKTRAWFRLLRPFLQRTRRAYF